RHDRNFGERRPYCMDHLRTWRHVRANAGERGCRARWLAVVVAQQHWHIVSVWTNHSNRLEVLPQRQHIVLILQQHDRFACRLKGELAMCGRVVCGEWDLRVRHHLRRIEHSEAEARREQSLESYVDLGL